MKRIEYLSHPECGLPAPRLINPHVNHNNMPQANQAIEDAPSPREYGCLKRAAKNKVKKAGMEDDLFRLECTFMLRVMGELGLRAGELTHITEEWIDFTENKIYIQGFDKCEFGKDGGPCGYCMKQARRSAEAHDDLSLGKAVQNRWEPKGQNAIREISFGWDKSLVELIHHFFEENSHIHCSRCTINRRIDKIAEHCKWVDVEDIYPHALRAHAAMYHARKGMRAYHLTEFMGWGNIEGAMPYIKMAPNDVESELKRVHGGSRV